MRYSEAEKEYAFILRNEWEEKLFIQCYCKVLNTDAASYRSLGRIAMAALSKPQYIELKTVYQRYCKEWEIELRHLWLAFINVHDIFAPDTPTVDIPSEQLELLAEHIQQIGAHDG